MGQSGDELIDKIWSALYEKQQAINRQMEESEKKFFQRAEENRLFQEKVERKFFDRLEENRLLMEKCEKKYLDQLEEKERQLAEIWQKIYQELEANRIKKEEYEAQNKDSKNTKRNKNKLPYYQIEMAEHPVYIAIIRLLSERGYNIDSDTLKLYWELITSVTRSAEYQND
ncbi:MAG: hypothetical protein FWC03_03890 [Treponema sp.]|nr:hypothetical protein [Treponema sp.]